MYPPADWKNHPEKAALYCSIVILGSIVTHLVVNLTHDVRQQLYVYFENRKAAAKMINRLKIICV